MRANTSSTGGRVVNRTLLVLLVGGSWALVPLALGQSAAAQPRFALTSPSPALDGPSIDDIVQQAYLKASNTGVGDFFGLSVSVSGETVVIGALSEDSNATGVNGDQSNNGAEDSGAAYVFVRSGAGWIQQAYLKASNTDKLDWFGASVSLSGDTLVVGAYREASNSPGVNGDQSNNSAWGAGAAYVFVRTGTTWSQEAYLKASNPQALDLFGLSVSVSGDTVLVGAHGEASDATGVNGDQSNNNAELSGAAYVFVRNGTSWSQQAYLKASNTGAHDFFGDSVSVSGDTAVVGAPEEDSNATGVNGDQNDNHAGDSGAAYVFVRSGMDWSQQAYLKASNTDLGDGFGAAVSVSGDTVLVGAYGEGSDATGVNGDQRNENADYSGAVYAFTRNGATWTQQAYLKASNTGGGDVFGTSVAVSGNTAVVGAVQEDSNAIGVNGDQTINHASQAGAAYVFVRSGTSWSQLAYLKASNTGANDEFGVSAAVSGDTVAVGAYLEDSDATGVNGDQSNNNASVAGAAYVFDLDLDAWADLGSGLAGSSGVPLLVGSGPLAPSSGNQLDLSGADPSTPATLVFGLSLLDAPFKGGTLVPAPLLLVPLATNPSGALSLPFLWPSNVPPGTALYFQVWISDPGAISGFSASNALEGVSA
jgi:hypothetical protein